MSIGQSRTKGDPVKKIILIMMLLSICSYAHAANDIDVTEVKVDVTKWRLTDFICHVETSECTVVYKKGYFTDPQDANTFVNLGETKRVRFIDVTDNPDTPEDETKTDFTDLIAFINSKSNIRTSLITATKTLLGI